MDELIDVKMMDKTRETESTENPEKLKGIKADLYLRWSAGHWTIVLSLYW